nr:predicted GPI-anchored protein 58 [Taeniopygia guttata]
MERVCAAVFTAFSVAYSGYFFTQLARHITRAWRESAPWSPKQTSEPPLDACLPEEEAKWEEDSHQCAPAATAGPEHPASSKRAAPAPAPAASAPEEEAEEEEGANEPAPAVSPQPEQPASSSSSSVVAPAQAAAEEASSYWSQEQRIGVVVHFLFSRPSTPTPHVTVGTGRFCLEILGKS